MTFEIITGLFWNMFSVPCMLLIYISLVFIFSCFYIFLFLYFQVSADLFADCAYGVRLYPCNHSWPLAKVQVRFQVYTFLVYEPPIFLHTLLSIGTTRPIPPNRRLCLGCIWWKHMSNPKRLRWNIILTETYESRSRDYKPIRTSWTTRNRNYSVNST